jgi:hypothetical protein
VRKAVDGILVAVAIGGLLGARVILTGVIWGLDLTSAVLTEVRNQL